MKRAFPRTLVAAALLAVSGAFVVVPAASAAETKPTLRAEVGKPLQEAQAALQAKDYATALAKVGEAEKVGSLNPYEQYLAERLRALAATGANDAPTALKAYAAVLASDQLPAADKPAMLEIASRLAYGAKDYAQAARLLQQYRAAGGGNDQLLGLLPQALYLSNDYAGAQQELAAVIARLEQSGQKPGEIQLQLLASSAAKQNDMATYGATLEKLVALYPQPKYWSELIVRTASKPGFAARLRLDVYRLKLAAGVLDSGDEALDATQLAIDAGLPAEAEHYLQLAQAKGASGSAALKVTVAKKLAEDKASLAEGEKAAAQQASGDALVATGLNYIGYGQYDKGIALMQQGIAKGGLKKADDARLHLGYAQVLAGQSAAAQATLKSVAGSDGSADLARLWTMLKTAR
ncbi:hypothetical protein [Solimonas variicoloris]|uniref:hypothetical protein n=1 Tax=Solimonas variicoloris TaxID=254408 RepID=UPI000361C8D7|nr:hypothetical protein [Solimonas variicoloris]